MADTPNDSTVHTKSETPQNITGDPSSSTLSNGQSHFSPTSSIRSKRTANDSPGPQPPNTRIKNNAYNPEGVNHYALQHMFESQIFKIREQKRLEKDLRQQIKRLQQKESLISGAFSAIGRAWTTLNREFDMLLPFVSNKAEGSKSKVSNKEDTKSTTSKSNSDLNGSHIPTDLISLTIDRVSQSHFFFPHSLIETEKLPQTAVDPLQHEIDTAEKQKTAENAQIKKSTSRTKHTNDQTPSKDVEEEEEESTTLKYSLSDVSGMEAILSHEDIDISSLQSSLEAAIGYTSSLLSNLVTQIQVLNEENDSILSLLQESKNNPKGLNKKTTKLLEDVTGTRTQIKALQKSYDELVAADAILKQDNSVLSEKLIYSLQSVKSLDRTIQWLSEDLQTEQTRCDRLRSKNTILDTEVRTLQKEIEQLKNESKSLSKHHGSSVPQTGDSSNDALVSATDHQKTKKPDPSKPLDVEDIATLPLEEQVQHYKLLLDIRLQEMNKIEQRNHEFAQRLTKKQQDHNRALANLKPTFVTKSQTYISLQNEHSKCSQTIQNLQTELKQLKDKFKSHSETSKIRIEDLETRMQHQLQTWSDKRAATQKELKQALETVDGFKDRLEQAQNAFRGREKMAKTISDMTDSFSNLVQRFETITQEQRQVISQRTKLTADSTSDDVTSLAKACDDLSEQLEQTIQQLITSQQNNAELNKRLTKQQDVWDNLVHERMKSDQYHSKLSQQHTSIQGQLESLTSLNEQTNSINSQLTQKIELLKSKIANYEAAEAISTQIHSELEAENSKLETEIQILNGKISSINLALEKSEKSVENKLTQIQHLHNSLNQAREQNTLFKQKFASLRVNGAEVLESELDEYKSKLTCSLCSLRHKSTALKTCGHIFCSECMQSRISARNRKCPGCMQAFSKSDLITLYFDEGTNSND